MSSLLLKISSEKNNLNRLYQWAYFQFFVQDAQYAEKGTEARYGSEVNGSDGADTNQSLRENNRIKYQANNVNPLIPGINAPIV